MSDKTLTDAADRTDLIELARADGRRDAREGREWDTFGFETQAEINAYFEGYREKQ
jgi:hypothetical protein